MITRPHHLIKPTIWLILLFFLAACRQPETASVAPPAAPTMVAVDQPSAEPTALPFIDPADWPPAESGTISVDASVHHGPISPLIFGTNHGPWTAVPVNYLEEANNVGVTLLRWPGGEFGDENNVTETDIDRFMALARQIGAEPHIQARLRNGTPEQAAELVRYINIEKEYGVRYWAVGNEPNLFPEAEYDLERFLADWRAIGEAMLAVDPTIQLVGPEITGYLAPPATDPFTMEAREWMEAFLRANGDLVDVVSIHRYPLPVSMMADSTTIEQLGRTSEEYDTMLPDLRVMVRETTGRDIPLAVTEFNSDWTKAAQGEATPDSLANAVWLADVLGRLMEQDVLIGGHFVLASRGSLGSWGLLGPEGPRPSYYVYPLLRHFGPELIYAAAGHPWVSAYAALTGNGDLTILIPNRGTDAAQLSLSLAGHPGGTASIYRLSAERVETGTVNEPAETAEITDGTILDIPAQSVTLIVIGQ
jgi:hypothetical protein